MPEGRALYFAEHIGSYQYRMRVHDHRPADDSQWWTFDKRTHSIRAWTKRNYAISHKIGHQFRIDQEIVLREWRGESYQRMDWWDGSSNNLRAPSGKCLTLPNNKHA